MYPAALLFRIFLQSLQRELGMAYALRAAAAGFPRSTIVLREAFPNALPAPLASAANAVAFFFTSAFFIETVIGIAGLGRLAQDAVRQKDLATLSGVCLAYCVVVVSTSALLNALAALARRGGT
jgi:peptide/nickel transport system permease protein